MLSNVTHTQIKVTVRSLFLSPYPFFHHQRHDSLYSTGRSRILSLSGVHSHNHIYKIPSNVTDCTYTFQDGTKTSSVDTSSLYTNLNKFYINKYSNK